MGHLKMELEVEDRLIFPLTATQLNIWRRCRHQTTAYNAAFRVEIAGPLEPEILERSLAAVVQRHEALRSCCAIEEGEPVGVIHPQVACELAVTDLTSLTTEASAARLVQLSTDESRHHFDLSAAPLFRFHLIRLEPQLWVLTMTLHQIMIDGWAFGIILKEVASIYEALALGQEPNLPQPTLQLADYAFWLRERLQAPESAPLIETLARSLGNITRLELPRRQGTGIVDFESDIVSIELSSEDFAVLQDATRGGGTTLFALGASACVAMLARLTRQRDIAVGTPVSGRSSPELEGVVGTTVNAMIVGGSVEPETTLAELQERISSQIAAELDHQYIPIEHLADVARRAGQAIPDPLYSVAFIAQRAFGGNVSMVFDFAGCHMRSLPSISQGAPHDLFLFMVERENGWRLSLEYKTDFFSRGDALAIVGNFRTMLLAAARTPHVPVASVPLEHDGRLADPPAVGAIVSAAHPSCPSEEAHGEPLGDTEAFDCPASIIQERYYFLSRTFPESAAFNLPACMEIVGSLDRDCLRKALSVLAARHEAFRTRFEDRAGKIFQVIEPKVDFHLEIVELTGSSPDKLQKALLAESRKPFDIGACPLLRAKLFADGDSNFLVLTAHHIVADGHSIGVIERELWKAYEAIAAGTPPEFPDLPLQYVDYSEAQRAWMESDAAKEQRAFWLRKLAGRLKVANVPVDREPVPGGPVRSAVEISELPVDLVQGLRRVAAEHAFTVYQCAAGAFAALIREVSGALDILFGSPISNRNEEVANVVGPFANVLPVRLNIGDCQTLADVIQVSAAAITDAFDHHLYPFDSVMDTLDAPAWRHRVPVFQFFFYYQVAFTQAMTARDLVIRPGPPVAIDSPYELKFALIERQGRVELHVEYNTALFERATIERFTRRYTDLLGAVAAARLGDPLPASRSDDFTDADEDPEPPVPSNDGGPGSALEQAMAKEFAAVLKDGQCGRHTDFFSAGGQSIAAVRLFRNIEKNFGVKLAISTLLRYPTPAALAGYIEALTSGEIETQGSYRYLVPLLGEPANPRLPPMYICAGAGGNVINLTDIANELREHFSVIGVQARGILSGDEPHTCYEDMARDYLSEIRRFQPVGPYFLAGYSAGGLAAYEMAQQLTAAGETVECVVLFDTRMPIPRRLTIKDKLEILGKRVQLGGSTALTDWLVTKVRREWNTISESVKPLQTDELEARMRAATQNCCNKYTLRKYGGKVLLVRPKFSPVMILEDGRAAGKDTIIREDNFWSDFAPQLIIREAGDYDHLDFLAKPNAPTVAKAILETLDSEIAA